VPDSARTLPPIVVDASVWVARYVPTDAFHVESAAWVRRQLRARRVLFIPAILAPELAGSLARILNDAAFGMRAARDVMRLRCVRLVPVDSELAEEALRTAASLRLRGADSVYAALARRLGVQLVSWDKEQLARAGAVPPSRAGRTRAVSG